MSDQDYHDGWNDGKAGRGPDVDRMALGRNRCNDYEIGYLDSGFGDVPQRPSPAERLLGEDQP